MQRSESQILTTHAGAGLEGLLMPLLGGRVLAPLYQEEMQRLEAYARAHRSRTQFTRMGAETARR